MARYMHKKRSRDSWYQIKSANAH